MDTILAKRPYEITLWTLQGSFLATLKSYGVENSGQITAPKMRIADDGTQELTFSIPMRYPIVEQSVNGVPAHYTFIDNPLYENIQNGVIISNVRVLRVTQNKGEADERTFPFLITKVEESRKGKQLICQITASGLAFTELGKIGYQIELNQDLLESEFEKYTYRARVGISFYSNKECTENQTQLKFPILIQKNIEENYYFFIGNGYIGESGQIFYVKEEEVSSYQVNATIDYWLDKVFPNIKDNDGNVLEWLTPWSYEVKMNWDNYTQSNLKEKNKIYEDEHITSWSINEQTGSLQAGSQSELQEKARFVTCEKSNKYNITQDIAEAFGVYCRYEYDYDSSGNIKTIINKEGKLYTGRKVIFYNTFIKEEDALFINYEHSLNEITRTADTTDLVTKMYVSETENENMSDGMISIANTEINPTYENYILNFDYLYQTGAIDSYQYSQVGVYSAKMRDFNLRLKEKSAELEMLNRKVLEKEVELSTQENALNASKENLENYQVLASYQPDEVTEKTILQPESVMFLEQEDGSYQCSFSQSGIEPASLKIFETYGIDLDDEQDGATYKCRNLMYSYGDNTKKIKVIFDTETTSSFIIGINSKTGDGSLFPDTAAPESRLRYATFRFNPLNKYQAIIEEYQQKIPLQEEKIKELEDSLSILHSEIDITQAVYDGLLIDKAKEIEDFNSMMGAALKEGTWQADEYLDPGQRFSANENVRFVWDKEELGGEVLNYYYATLSDQENNVKTYYPYLELEEADLYNLSGAENSFEVILYREYYQYDIGEIDLAAGNYYGNISGIDSFYFTLGAALNKDAILRYYPARETKQLIYLVDGQETEISFEKTPKNSINYSFLSFQNSGVDGAIRLFVGGNLNYAFVEEANLIKSILFIERSNLSSDFKKARCYFNGIISWKDILLKENVQVWPRYYIEKQNVNLNTIKISREGKELINYEDFVILLNKMVPYLELKPSNNNPIINILLGNYSLIYEVSRANEMLYLDALQVSEDNSKPIVSYSVQVANLPGEPFIEIGALAFINDPELKFHNLQGYISEITFDLDNPISDEIVIANYKTRFEDLFSSIAASSEQMKTRGVYYERAANAFNTAGNLTADILQSSISSANLAFDFGGSNITINSSKGIIVQNTTPYANGIYGVVMIRGGGIFTASEKDDAGNYLWNTAITPLGINTKNFVAGQIDTNKIRIMSGSNMKFQWNATGLYAYRANDDQSPNYNEFVKYNEDGLRLYQNGIDRVEISWDGLILRNNEGDKTFYADPDTGNLTITGTIQAADGLIGGWVITKDGLWNKASGQENENGKWEVIHPDNYVGLVGTGDYAIFAGGSQTSTAKFKVHKDGTMYATGGFIQGDFIVTGNIGTPEFSSGALGTGWRIDGEKTYAEFNDLYVRGKLSAVTFEYEKISSVGGQLYIAPTMISGQDIILVQQENSSTVEITIPYENSGGRVWLLNDIVKINGIILNGQEGAYELNGATGRVVSLENGITFLCNDIIQDNNAINKVLVPQSAEEMPLSVNGMSLAKNASFIYYGSENNGTLTKEGILIDAASEYGPFIDVYDNSETPVTRLGNLKGINDPTIGQLEGYGLYSENVYLTGHIKATSGQIGGVQIKGFDKEWENVKNDSNNALQASKKIEIQAENGIVFYKKSNGDILPATLSFKAKTSGFDAVAWSWQFTDQSGIFVGGGEGSEIFELSYSSYEKYFVNDQLKIGVTCKDEEGNAYSAIETISIVNDGQDGVSPITLTIESSTGNIYINNEIVTTLTARVWQSGEEITNQFTAHQFVWTKTNSDGTVDEEWGEKWGQGWGNTIQINNSDVYRKAVFSCELREE